MKEHELQPDLLFGTNLRELKMMPLDDTTPKSTLILFTAISLMVSWTALAGDTDTRPSGLERTREKADKPFVLASNGQSPAKLVILADSELVTNAADWLNQYMHQVAGTTLERIPVDQMLPGGRYLVAAVGEQNAIALQPVALRSLHIEPLVGPQGFVIQRLSDPDNRQLLVCWSPSELGCRYGLIEILRSLKVEGRTVHTNIGRIIDHPQFPMRICYLNFAEHLQNAYNPNVLFDVPNNRWSRREWERFIDMISAYRYNVFEFWLVPTLFSPEASSGGGIQTEFAETMNYIIAYAKRRGVRVHPIVTINCVGRDWHYHCPKDPREHDELVALWDYWSRALKGNDMFGFFPGDPGGCTRNGCTPETYIDLCLELATVVRKNNPAAAIEVGTWGEPFAGWGVKLWTGNENRATRAMEYFLARLPAFPPGTFTSINLGFSPDGLPTYGGDARPYARRAAQTRPVLTWDYSVTEGEGTVIPHCRVRRILARRREELAAGCYSGGICYTMAPKLNSLSLFCCAEAYWNPALEAESILADYGRFVFGGQGEAIGPLLEEFEVIPDWGYYPPFPYTPQRLERNMAKLSALLERCDPDNAPRLPLLPTLAEYRGSLRFFADLFNKLGSVAAAMEEATELLKQAQIISVDHQGVVSLNEMEALCNKNADFSGKAGVVEIERQVRQLDVPSLRKAYWKTVYGIYDAIPSPSDPRAERATDVLLKRFHGQQATSGKLSS